MKTQQGRLLSIRRAARAFWSGARRSLAFWLSAIAVGAALGALLATRTGLLGQDRAWARIRETGVWRVGMDPSFPPFENLDVATGRPVGFDVDLAQAIADSWGVRVEFVGVGFDQLLDAVAAQRVDSAISALPVMPHRTREVRFSDSYIEAGMVLAVATARSAPLAASGQEEPATALAGRRVAVEWGSEGDALARAMQTQTQGAIELVLRNSGEAALAAVVAGEADAAIVDAISLALYNRAAKQLRIFGPPLRSDPYAVIVPADAPELLNRTNAALAELRRNGVLAELKARWLEADAP